MTSELGEDVLAPARVLVEKLKSWFKGNIIEWNQEYVDQTFQDIIDFMKQIKVEDNILRELDEIWDLKNKETFPLQAVLKKLPAYRDDIQSSKVEKVERKLKQLRDNEGYEVYIERRFKNTNLGTKHQI